MIVGVRGQKRCVYLDDDVLHGVVGGDAGHAHLGALHQVVKARHLGRRALHLSNVVRRDPASVVMVDRLWYQRLRACVRACVR